MPIKPSKNEDEYFARIEADRIKALARSIQKKLQESHEKMKQEEKEQLKKLHHMRCPKCGMELIEIDFKTVKIDKCSECEGIWLDKGELEQLMKVEKKFFSGMLNLFRK